MQINQDNILNSLKKWSICGEKTLQNNTLLICPTPHVAPQAWFHRIYKGISDEGTQEIEQKLNKTLPSDLTLFLKFFNGLNIFSDSLSVWGLRKSYSRSGEASFQPYDLIELNKEQEGQIPDSWILFGSYSWDGSFMIYDLSKNSNTVFRCDNDLNTIIQEWPNISTWINEEIERLSLLFDEKGIEYNEDTPTTP